MMMQMAITSHNCVTNVNNKCSIPGLVYPVFFALHTLLIMGHMGMTLGCTYYTASLWFVPHVQWTVFSWTCPRGNLTSFHKLESSSPVGTNVLNSSQDITKSIQGLILWHSSNAFMKSILPHQGERGNMSVYFCITVLFCHLR